MTLTDMVTAVLQELRVLSANETASSSDDTLVKARYERWRSLAAKRFLVDWDATDDIPAGAEDAVTLIVAYVCAPAFGKPKDRASYEEGWTMLFEYRDNWAPNTPTALEYY